MSVIPAFLYWDGKQKKENAWKLVSHLACRMQPWTRDTVSKKVREDWHLTLYSALQKIHSSLQVPALKHKCAPTQTHTYISYTHIMQRHIYKIYKILAKATFSYVKQRTTLHTRLVMKKKEWRQIPQEVLWEMCTLCVDKVMQRTWHWKLKHFCLNHHLLKINSFHV